MIFNRSYTYQDVLTRASMTIQIIDDVAIYKAQLFSSNGNIFGTYDKETDIFVVVYKGLEDITSKFSDIVWKRFSSNSGYYEEDLEWGEKFRNQSHIKVTKEDIIEKANIQCEVYTQLNGERVLAAADFISFIDINDMQGSPFPPENPQHGDLWLDTSVTPPRLMMWDANLGMWVEVKVAGQDRRNLIRNSNFYKKTYDFWTSLNNPVLDIESYSAKRWARIKNTSQSSNYIGISQTIMGEVKSDYSFQILSEVYDHSSNPNGNLLIAFYSIDKNNLKTLIKEDVFDIGDTPKVYTSTFKSLEDTSKIELIISGEKNSLFDFVFTNIKLEKYPIPTEWELAIEDIQDALDNKVGNTPEEVFESLTDGGRMQGIYIDTDENGEKDYYFNATYIKSGKLLGEYIEGKNLTVTHDNGYNTLEIDDEGNVTINAERLSISNSQVATNNDVNTAVDNIQIGGRNLVKDTGTTLELYAHGGTNENTGGSANSNFKKDPYALIKTPLSSLKNWEVGDTITFSYNWEAIGSNFSGNFKAGFNANPWEYTTTVTLSSSNIKGRVVHTRTLVKNDIVMTSTATAVRFRMDNIPDGTIIKISNLKVELGNKPTDWSPAPEDISNEIYNAIESQTSEDIFNKLTDNGQKQGIYMQNDQLYVNGQYINAKNLSVTNNTGKKTLSIDNNGNVDLDVNSLKISSSNVATENYTNTAIDNIQIGGRNLICQTSIVTLDTTGTYDSSTNTWNLVSTSGVGVTWGAGLKITGNKTRISYGQQYVCSFEIKVPVNCTWNVDINNYAVSGTSWNGNDNDSGGSDRITSSKSLIANVWTKCWFSYKNTRSGNTGKVDIYDNSLFGIINNTGSNISFQIRNVKGEIGNKPTDWSPAPEDISNAIDKAETKANNALQKKMGISLIVNQGTFAPNRPNKEGELYIHGFDENGNKADVDGYIINPNNDAKITITKGAINANDKIPYNQEIYLCYSNRLWFAWYNISDKKWKYLDANANSHQNTVNNLTWGDSHLVLGVVVADGAENYTSGFLYNTPKNYRDAIGNTIEFTTTKSQVSTIENNLNGITSTVSSIEQTTAAINTHITQNKQNIRCNELGVKINYSAFETSNAGEMYLHGYDENNNPVDTNGRIYWNGSALTIAKGMVNPDSNFPFNTDVYIFVNKNSSSIKIYGVYFDSTNKYWNYKQVIGGVAESGTNWTPTTDHIALGQFSMASAEVFNYAFLYETPRLLKNVIIDGVSITTRLKTAENKITDTAIVNTVKQHQTNGKATFAQTSEVEQTVEELQYKFTQSGGYNLIRNSTGASGNSNNWTHTGSFLGIGDNATIGSSHKKYMYLDNGTTTSEKFAFSSRFKLKPNTKYRFTGYFHNYTKCPSFDVYILSSTSLTDTDTSTSYTNVHHLIVTQNTNGAWKKYTVTFTTPANTLSGYVRIDNNGYNANGTNSNRVHWNCLILTEGELEVPWAPHPSEVYDGITTIDKDGITVTSSNVKSKTSMTSSGFKITKTDNNEDVFKVNADGTLYMKGQITVTGGSIPTSNLSGTISSSQLNSTITSDISTAKNNASTAVSTANTAKSTATTAQNTANTANSTANSVKQTVDSNSSNWTNSYNRVKEWASSAVTGTTYINGGMIAANTILASKLALGDLNNYSEINENTYNSYGFTKVADSSASNNPWYQISTLKRDTVISKTYTCKGGETFRVTANIYSTAKASSSSSDASLVDYRETRISIYSKNADGTMNYQHGAYAKNSTTNTSATITLPSTARTFYISIQINGWTPFSGTVRVRNVEVKQMSNGELIVDGAITANKIASGAITAGMITSGTLDASKVTVTNLNASNIKSGKLSASYIDATNLAVKGELISGQINGVGGIKFADGAVISSYDSHVPGFKGIKISAPSINLGDKVDIHTPTLIGTVTGKTSVSSASSTWTINSSGALSLNSSLTAENGKVYMYYGNLYFPQVGVWKYGTNLTLGECRLLGLTSLHLTNSNCTDSATLYCKNTNFSSVSSIDNILLNNHEEVNGLDKIMSLCINNTEEGLRIVDDVSTYDNEESNSKILKTIINKDNKTITKNIDAFTTISTLCKAVQELKQENDKLKNDINEIKGKI